MFVCTLVSCYYGVHCIQLKIFPDASTCTCITLWTKCDNLAYYLVIHPHMKHDTTVDMKQKDSYIMGIGPLRANVTMM